MEQSGIELERMNKPWKDVSWTRVSRVKGSVRTRGEIGTEAKRKEKEKIKE